MKTSKKDGSNKLTEYLKDFMEQANDSIHEDLERSKDYLERHELDDYIEEEGLNIQAIEDNEENLTVRDVLELGIHWANHSTHRNWHEAMDELAEKHDVTKLNGGHKGIKIVTDPSELPKEVRDALVEALSEIIKPTKKKRGGKK